MGRLIRLDMLMNDADDIMRSLKAKADVLYERAHTHTHTHCWFDRRLLHVNASDRSRVFSVRNQTGLLCLARRSHKF